MQILSLTLKNVKSHRDTELSFAPGINVLSGPNGVGKSTVFEAIGYALFGVDARDFVANVDRFLSIGAKRGEISVTFRTGDETWRTTRTVGTPAKWLLAKEQGGSFEIEEHAGIEETQARIAGLLGLDNGRPLAEQFKQIIGPFQNDFLGPFVIRQATRRQDAFDAVLGIDGWRKTFTGTSRMLSAVQEKVRLLAAEIDARQEQIAVLPEWENDLEKLKTAEALKEAELKEREHELKVVADLLLQLDRHKERIDAAMTALEKTGGAIEAGEAHLAGQKHLVEQAEKAAAIVERTRSGQEAFERADNMLIRLREQEKKRRGMEVEAAALEQEADRCSQKYEHEHEETERTGRQLAEEEVRLANAGAALQPDVLLLRSAGRLPELRKELESAKEERALVEGRAAALLEGQEKLSEGVCPYFREPCRNLADDDDRDLFSSRLADLHRRRDQLDERINLFTLELAAAEKAHQEIQTLSVRREELDKQLGKLRERKEQNRQRADNLADLQARAVAATARAAAVRKGLAAFATLDEEIAGAEREKARCQPDRDAFHTNRKDAAELDGRKQVLARYELRLAELRREQETGQTELQRLKESYAADRHRELGQRKEDLLALVATVRQQVAALQADRRRVEGELDRLRRIRSEIELRGTEKAAREGQEKLVKFLRNQIFKNVSAQLSERFREEISIRADRIYRTIADTDEELVWGEGYQVTLRDQHEGTVRERSDDQLSGGQMMSAVVALRLALLQTTGARIAFFDEPTSNLDVNRRENLAQAFRAIEQGREAVTEHWYDQLFLISHDLSFTEITDQIIPLGD